MDELISELNSTIYGSGVVESRAVVEKAPAKKTAERKQFVNTTYKQVASTGASQSKKSGGEVIKLSPEMMIPLDDGDFKGF